MSQSRVAALLAEQSFGREERIIFLTQKVTIAGK